MIKKCSKCNQRLGKNFTLSIKNGKEICSDCAYKEVQKEVEKTFGIRKDKKHGN